MSDSMVGNRKFRTFNVMDDGSREVLAIEIDTSLSAKRVIRTLQQIIRHRGKPQMIRTDNGPEFTYKDFELWCTDNEIKLQYIQPGRPMQNGFIERFNRLYREAVLDAYLFFDLAEVRTLTDEWIEEYNHRRPHESLQNQTPNEWKINLLNQQKTLICTVWKKGYLHYYDANNNIEQIKEYSYNFSDSVWINKKNTIIERSSVLFPSELFSNFSIFNSFVSQNSYLYNQFFGSYHPIACLYQTADLPFNFGKQQYFLPATFLHINPNISVNNVWLDSFSFQFNSKNKITSTTDYQLRGTNIATEQFYILKDTIIY